MVDWTLGCGLKLLCCELSCSCPPPPPLPSLSVCLPVSSPPPRPPRPSLDHIWTVDWTRHWNTFSPSRMISGSWLSEIPLVGRERDIPTLLHRGTGGGREGQDCGLVAVARTVSVCTARTDLQTLRQTPPPVLFPPSLTGIWYEIFLFQINYFHS